MTTLTVSALHFSFRSQTGSHWSPRWSQTQGSPASAAEELALKVCFLSCNLALAQKASSQALCWLFFFLAFKVPGWLHIPHGEMEVERAEIKLPLATSYRTARSGAWPTFNLLSYSPHLFHTVYESVLQVLNTCMLRTLPEDLTTPRDLEPVPLWEESLFLSLQINLPMWSHLKNEHLNTDTNLLLPANGGVGGMCSE